MANYTINREAKKVIVTGTLTETEKEIIGIYISRDYMILPKETRTKGKSQQITKEDIIKYFELNSNRKGLKEFIAKEKEKVIKNGKERSNGFFGAREWFKATYAEAYNEIMTAKKNQT